MRNINCTLCELGDGCNNPCLWGEGNPNAKLMLVGEAPGHAEDIQGAPFRGMAGKLLNNILDRLGIDRKDLYLTNVIKCHPCFIKLPTGKKLKVLIDACRVYLDEEIATVKPKVILALGATAASAFNIKNISMVEGTEPASGVLVALDRKSVV